MAIDLFHSNFNTVKKMLEKMYQIFLIEENKLNQEVKQIKEIPLFLFESVSRSLPFFVDFVTDSSSEIILTDAVSIFAISDSFSPLSKSMAALLAMKSALRSFIVLRLLSISL